MNGSVASTLYVNGETTAGVASPIVSLIASYSTVVSAIMILVPTPPPVPPPTVPALGPISTKLSLFLIYNFRAAESNQNSPFVKSTGLFDEMVVERY